MKVTLVGAFPPQQKGEAHYLGQYADALQTLGGAEISVVSQYVELPTVEASLGFSVHRAVQDRSKSGTSYRAQTELVDAVLATKCDVMHLHYGPGPDYGGRLGESLCDALGRLRHAGIRTVLTLHSVWLPADVRDQAKRLGVPRLLHPFVVAYFGRFMRKLRASLDAELLLVSAPDSPMTQAFSEAYGVRNIGEEVHGCHPRCVPFVANDEPLVFAFGFLRPDKGFDVLIEAFKDHLVRGGRGRLEIIGRPQSAADTAYADRLLATARSVPDNRCNVDVRYLPDEELEERLRVADIIAIPYLRNVGASGPLHHALGLGKPVICSDAGHNAALRQSLEVVSAGDISELRRALDRTICDSVYRRQLAQQAADIAVDRSWVRLAERNYALYQELL